MVGLGDVGVVVPWGSVLCSPRVVLLVALITSPVGWSGRTTGNGGVGVIAEVFLQVLQLGNEGVSERPGGRVIDEIPGFVRVIAEVVELPRRRIYRATASGQSEGIVVVGDQLVGPRAHAVVGRYVMD